MFNIISITDAKGTILRAEHIASGARFDIPEGTKQIAVDKDGEIYAYESGLATILEGHSGWSDDGYEGFVVQIGQIPNEPAYMAMGVFPLWRDSLTEVKVKAEPVKAVAHAKPGGALYDEIANPARLDGSALRAKVTEMLDRNMKNGVIGASRARHFLRDLGSEGFTFTNYRTADLVLILTHIGCNMSNTRDYIAFRAIDDAVHSVWGDA
jgi:hypothetical protein